MSAIATAQSAVRWFHTECLLVLDGLHDLALKRPWLLAPVAMAGVVLLLAAYLLSAPWLALWLAGAAVVDAARRV